MQGGAAVPRSGMSAEANPKERGRGRPRLAQCSKGRSTDVTNAPEAAASFHWTIRTWNGWGTAPP